MDVADPIPPSVKALVELFKNELSAVTFPGVDGAILEQLITDVQTYTDAVIKAEAALEAARNSLRESEEVLAIKSQKALAYARVYAEDRPEISAKVDYVARIAGSAPVSSTPPARDRDGGSDAPKRRGRQKKAAAVEATDATPVAPAVEPAVDPGDMTPLVPGVMEVSVEEVDASVLDAMAN
ncbi:MAG TPA: hypothetical protein PK156_33955 [Polyangium sp.]|nr:hypothetical protein [Polyangium sp.]